LVATTPFHRARRTGWASGGLILSFLLVLATGCGDRDRYRGIQLTSPETVPALDFNGHVASVPALASAWGDGRVSRESVDRWRASWGMSLHAGRELRAGIYREVAPPLAERATEEEVGRALEGIDRAVRGAESLLTGSDRDGTAPGNLRLALERAEEERERGVAALAGGDRILAIQHLLAGADELQGVTPEAIARSLLAQGEASLREGEAGRTAEGDDLRRAERLLEGARAALDDDAPVLALRRSWYAVRLLEGRVAP
jgi:hypothetical protein